MCPLSINLSNMKLLKQLVTIKDRINEYKMKRDLIKELNKFYKNYNSLPTSVKKLSPEFHNILKVVDFWAIETIPLRSITITIPFDNINDNDNYRVDVEAADWSILEYTDWRDHKRYVNNVKRKARELSNEELDRVREYIKSLRKALKSQEENEERIRHRLAYKKKKDGKDKS